MSEINYQALREAAQNAKNLGGIKNYKRGEQAVAEFKSLITPHIVLALLEERERNQQYIKRRDQENEDIALTVGKLLIENGRLVADTLRHLADNEIDSDYFAITSTNENGTEIDHEMAVTDYALQAAGTVDELVAALESAEKRIAELSASHSKLRDTMAGIHNTIRMDGGYTPLAAILNAAKRAYEESASAAGIRIKGGE
ncbi:ead/Ea22-like family protein [Escherichia coli]|nr:ead/Ea22-like family protein [Escherichia coli]